MEHRSHAWSVAGRSTCASLPLLLALVLSSCGSQDPAFRETVSDRVANSGDSQGTTADVVGAGSADADRLANGNREGAIDPEVIAAAMEKTRSRGAMDDYGSRGGMDSADEAYGRPGSEPGLGTLNRGSSSGNTGVGNAGSSAGGSSTGSSAGGSSTGSSAGGSSTGSSAGGGSTGSSTGGGTTGSGSSSGGSGPVAGGSGNVAQDVANNGGSGGFGSESNLPINWRTVQLTQGGPGKVDILWVVDTSGSMSEEQTYLASNFNAMIGALKTAGQDFQTAVTTTDVCQDQIPDDLAQRVCPVPYGGSPATRLRGSFVGEVGRKVLKQGDADLVSRFNTYTKQGVDGSGFEHGLKAAEMAISKSLAGQNEALIRQDAFLAVIVVSDEEDDGIGLSQTDAFNGHNFFEERLTSFRYTDEDFISYARGVKGTGNFSVSAITPTRLANSSLCSAPHTQPLEEGTQYIAAARKSGGIIQSICETNWNQSLAMIGADLSAQISQVVLPSTPDPLSIRVKVDGVETQSWTYVPANRAVKFNAGSVPQKGANIVVGYVER